MNWRKNLRAILVAACLMFISSTNSSAFVTGDVDDDGFVRLADALLVMRYIVGTQSLIPLQRNACDVAGDNNTLIPDGVCDIVDAVKILSKAYGLIIF